MINRAYKLTYSINLNPEEWCEEVGAYLYHKEKPIQIYFSLYSWGHSAKINDADVPGGSVCNKLAMACHNFCKNKALGKIGDIET